MSKKQANAVATTEEKPTGLAVVGPQTDNAEEILASNIIIPKILLMQGLSELVSDGKAVMGDMVRSTTGEKLGNAEKPVEIIPLTYNTTWVKQEKVGNAWEYRGQEPMTAANQDLPWQYEENGTQWKRTKSLNLYALLPSDVVAEKAEMEKAKNGEMPDPDKALLPVMISFRSTSFNAGKVVNTHFAKARKFGLQGYVSTLKLKCYKEKNELGTFYVFDVETAGKTPKDAFEVCEYWRNIVASGKAQVDDKDEAERPVKDYSAVSEGSNF